MPALGQDDERFRCMVEPFIVYRQAARAADQDDRRHRARTQRGGSAGTDEGNGAPVEELSRSTEALAALVSPAVVQIFTTSYVPAAGVVAREADLITTQRCCSARKPASE
jgi:hypothetical protein